MSDTIHTVLALWVRPVEGGPMEPREELELRAGEGVVGDHAYGRMRHVTVVFEDDWNAAAATLGRAVDPAGRRANVLVSGGGGQALARSAVALGDAVLEMKGETAPCPVMEHAAPGMQAALGPDMRAGLWGRVVTGATIRVGDVLRRVEVEKA